MTRQQRRKEMRDIEGELKLINKHTPFLKYMKDDDFNVSAGDKTLLESGKHPNEVLQKKYTYASKLFARVYVLNERYLALKQKKDVLDVKK